jgi:DNA-binding transcriptional ArsR family regulator
MVSGPPRIVGAAAVPDRTAGQPSCTDIDLDATVAELDALGQGTRLRIIELVVNAGPSGMAAGEIARILGVRPSTLSHHLLKLKGVGLVTAKRDGKSIRYSAASERTQLLLDRVEGRIRPRLVAVNDGVAPLPDVQHASTVA